MMERSAEVQRASKALIFFCTNMEPEGQWKKAVNLMKEMSHMEKASVWKSMVDASNTDGALLSVRRTAYKRALREAEEEEGGPSHLPAIGVQRDAGGVPGVVKLFTQDNGENELLTDLLQDWFGRYNSGDKPRRGSSLR